MNRVTALLAALAISAPSIAQAAQDPGLMLTDYHAHERSTGIAAQASVSIPLSGRGAGRSTGNQARFDLRAGPSMTTFGGFANSEPRTRVAPTLQFSSDADTRASLMVAGQPVWARAARYELSREDREAGNGPRKNLSTVGAVAIGVGVALVVGALVLRDRIVDASE